MEKINTETGEHSGASLCSEIYFILQELNDDSYRRYWFDDTQPANTEKSLDRLERWVKRDMKKHSAHYAHCRHRIIKREETEVSFPNTETTNREASHPKP